MIKKLQRWVVKIGSSTISPNRRVMHEVLEAIAAQVSAVRAEGIEVVLVSSGAVAAGREQLKIDETGQTLAEKQVLAAVGQARLMRDWTETFARHGVHVAQVLLTQADFVHRQHYLNLRNTFEGLLAHGVVPIVNENDPVAIRELQVGDNDTLAARVANLIGAEWLILITDQPGVFTDDPRRKQDAVLISEIEPFEVVEAKIRKQGGLMGTGGMATKIEAARLASHTGTSTLITTFAIEYLLPRIASGERPGTCIQARNTIQESRKRWLLSEKKKGALIVDNGCARKLLHEGASLLPVGVIDVTGTFDRGEVVGIRSETNKLLAIGICNYSAEEVLRICRKKSQEIPHLLGYSYGPEVVHRDNMSVMNPEGIG